MTWRFSRTQPEFTTIARPVTIKVPFGNTPLQPGVRVRVISRDATIIRVQYIESVYTIPADAVR